MREQKGKTKRKQKYMFDDGPKRLTKKKSRRKSPLMEWGTPPEAVGRKVRTFGREGKWPAIEHVRRIGRRDLSRPDGHSAPGDHKGKDTDHGRLSSAERTSWEGRTSV